MKAAQDIILKPVITEKSMDQMNQKRYTFRVASDSTKPEIKAAIEQLFNVKVASVNTITMKRKPKRVRYVPGYTSEWKKAIVTLTEDSDTIGFFDGLN